MNRNYFLPFLLIITSPLASISQYCTSAGPSYTTDSNIGSVSLLGETTSISYTGCPGVLGVEDQTTQVADVIGGNTYSVDLVYGTCGGTYVNTAEVWIDFNGNQNFDANESIGTWAGSPTSPLITHAFTVPSNALNGTHRIRVMQQEGGVLPLDPCESFFWGSVTDFSITISGGSSCVPVSALNTDGFSADSVFFSWAAGGTETEWFVEWGPQGFTPGTGTAYTTSDLNDTIIGTTLGTFYDIYVQSICGVGDTSGASVVSFNTAISNDDACNAIMVAVDGSINNYTNVGATTQASEPGLTPNNTVWFSFVAPASGNVAIATCGEAIDTELEAFSTADCSNFGNYVSLGYADYNPWGCSGSHPAGIELCGLTAGDTILFWVGSYYNGTTGTIPLQVYELSLNAGSDSSANACAGDTLNLWDNLSNNDNQFGTWSYPSNPGVVFNDSLANTGDMTFTSNDFYYIVSNACGADTASIEVNTFQPANTGTPISPFEVCNWGNIYLYDGLSGTIDIGGSWNDDTGTGLLTGASLQVSALNAGSYQFTYTASNGVCADASTTITVDINDCTGIDEAVANNFSVYPNPSIGVFTIDFDGNVSNIELSILDLNGRTVHTQAIVTNKTNVNLSTIANGVYTVVLVSNDTVSTTKLVVAK
jgi:hypothetical protein